MLTLPDISDASPVDKLKNPEDSVLIDTALFTPVSLEPDENDKEPPMPAEAEPPRIFTDARPFASLDRQKSASLLCGRARLQ